jgi:hypothetical protein
MPGEGVGRSPRLSRGRGTRASVQLSGGPFFLSVHSARERQPLWDSRWTGFLTGCGSARRGSVQMVLDERDPAYARGPTSWTAALPLGGQEHFQPPRAVHVPRIRATSAWPSTPRAWIGSRSMSFSRAPRQLRSVIDLDATDFPIHDQHGADPDARWYTRSTLASTTIRASS